MQRSSHYVLYFLLDHNIGIDCEVDDTGITWDNTCDTSCTQDNKDSLISYGTSQIVTDTLGYGITCETLANYTHQRNCCENYQDL